MQREEEEAEQLAALPKFVAREFNAAELASGGSMRTERRPPPITEAQPFRFVTDDRAAQREKKAPEVRPAVRIQGVQTLPPAFCKASARKSAVRAVAPPRCLVQ